MPSIGEFNSKFAEIIGASPGSVLKVQRVLRDARLITTGARGVNAPDFTPTDAARMMLAFLVSDRPSLAVAAVLEFGKLTVSLRDDFESEGDDPVHTIVSSCMADFETLEEALSALIGAFAKLPRSVVTERCGGASVSCVTNDMTASLQWLSGYCLFSNAGSLKEALAADADDSAASFGEIAKVMRRDVAAAGKYLEGASGVRTSRIIRGDVIADVAALFAEPGDA